MHSNTENLEPTENVTSEEAQPLTISIPSKLQDILRARQAEAKKAVDDFTKKVDQSLHQSISDTLAGFLATLDLPETTRLTISPDFTELIEE